MKKFILLNSDIRDNALEWLPVIGFEGAYEVSSCGRVRSLDRYVNHTRGDKLFKKGQPLKPDLRSGYYAVVLMESNERKKLLVHRLVALSFIENPENKKTVNHIDGDKLNNHVSNLEWTTHSENCLHAFRVLGRETKAFGKAYNARAVRQLDLSGNLVRVWDSASRAQAECGFDHGTVSKCCRKRKGVKSCGGFLWEYA